MNTTYLRHRGRCQREHPAGWLAIPPSPPEAPAGARCRPLGAHHAVLERDSRKSEWKRRMGRSTGWCTHSSYFSPR